MLSYSPISIPIGLNGENKSTTLIRRDLFDARFQLIAEDERTGDSKVAQDKRDSNAQKHGARQEKGTDALAFIDNPSDLVPGIYEGGLKTWECSLDLVEVLHSVYGSDLARDIRGKRILEVSEQHFERLRRQLTDTDLV